MFLKIKWKNGVKLSDTVVCNKNRLMTHSTCSFTNSPGLKIMEGSTLCGRSTPKDRVRFCFCFEFDLSIILQYMLKHQCNTMYTFIKINNKSNLTYSSSWYRGRFMKRLCCFDTICNNTQKSQEHACGIISKSGVTKCCQKCKY